MAGARNQSGRVAADNAEAAGIDAVRIAEEKLAREQAEMKNVSLRRTEDINAAEQARVGIMQSQLQLMQERSARMTGDVQRIGAMTVGERLQARANFEVARRHVDAGGEIALLSSQMRASGRQYAPDWYRQQEEASGNRYLREEHRNMGGIAARDWANGANVGDTRQQERALAVQVNQSLDAVAVRSANAIAEQFNTIMQSMVVELNRRFDTIQASINQQIRQSSNLRQQ